jgi:predicted PurR-regulated permease PerM
VANRRRKKRAKPAPPTASAAGAPAASVPAVATAAVAGEAAMLAPLVVDTRLFMRAIAISAALLLAWQLRDLGTTLLFAAVLVFLGAPLVGRLEARSIPRAAGAALFLAAALTLFALLSLLIVPGLVADLRELFAKLPDALDKLESWGRAQLHVDIPVSLSELSKQIFAELEEREDFAQGASKALSSGGKALGKGAGAIFGFVMGAVGAAGRAVFIPVLAFFALTELPEIGRFARQLAPQHLVSTWEGTLVRINSELTSLVKGQLTVALIMAGIYAVGLWACGVPFAFGIAILAGLGYLIPFASAPICVVLSVLFTLLEVRDGLLVPLVGSVVVAGVVQLAEGWVLTPRVVGESAGLSPLAVILAVTVAGSLFGFVGVLFALPAATAIGVILKEKALRAA